MSNLLGPLDKSRLVQLYVLQRRKLVVEAANTGARRALGYRRHEMEGLPFGALCPEAETGELRDTLKALRAAGKGAREIDLRLRRRDGTLLRARARFRSVKGQRRRLLVECLDLTEQRRDQAGLVRATTLLRAVERDTATGAWRLAPPGDRLELTAAAAALLQPPRRTVPLDRFLRTLDRHSRNTLTTALQRCATGGDAFALGVTAAASGSRIGWVSGERVRSTGGGFEIIGTLAAQPPTAVSGERALMTGSAREQAAQANGAACLADKLHHELARRFEGLSQLARGAADAVQEPAARRLLVDLELQARRGDSLVRELQLIARQRAAAPGAARLNEVITPLSALLENIAAPHAIEWHLAANLPVLALDPAACQLALPALLRLVSRALHEAGGQLRLTTGQGRFDAAALAQRHAATPVPPGRYQYLQVSGSGPAARTPPAANEVVFETAILVGFAKLHDGALLLPRPGAQTAGAALLLPLADAAEPAPSARPAPRPRLLVAEQDAEALEQLKEIAPTLGVEIVPVVDIRHAVRAFQDNPQGYAAVMLSHDAATTHLSRAALLIREANAGVVLLIASGFNERYAARRFAAIGATGFVQKPYVGEELLALLRQHRVPAVAQHTA